MNDKVNETLSRMMARGGTPFHEIAPDHGPVAMIRSLLGMPPRTHCYERLDGTRVLLTKDEASEIAPIELEMLSLKAARRTMMERRRRRAG